jgi:ribosome-binding factor A
MCQNMISSMISSMLRTAATQIRYLSSSGSSVSNISNVAAGSNRLNSLEKRNSRNVMNALLAALSNDGILSESIVKDAGISFVDVRLSKDGSRAFVLWSSWKDDVAGAHRILAENTSRLKRVAARAIKGKRTPFLEFISDRDDEVSSRRLERDELVRRLDELAGVR